MKHRYLTHKICLLSIALKLSYWHNIVRKCIFLHHYNLSYSIIKTVPCFFLFQDHMGQTRLKPVKRKVEDTEIELKNKYCNIQISYTLCLCIVGTIYAINCIYKCTSLVMTCVHPWNACRKYTEWPRHQSPYKS